MSVDFANPQRTAFDLTGKVVVIVGGGQMPGDKIGNGRATALVAARHGAEVVAVDLNMAAAQETVDMVLAEGGTAYAVHADVAEREDCEHIFDVVMQRSGRVDGMVYSVAINPPFDRERNEMSLENFNKGIDVNMLGCFYCNSFAAQCMEKNEGSSTGSIVNFSSIASLKNEVGLNIGIMPYALGKCGLNYITELTAAQYADVGIRANTLMLVRGLFANNRNAAGYGHNGWSLFNAVGEYYDHHWFDDADRNAKAAMQIGNKSYNMKTKTADLILDLPSVAVL